MNSCHRRVWYRQSDAESMWNSWPCFLWVHQQLPCGFLSSPHPLPCVSFCRYSCQAGSSAKPPSARGAIGKNDQGQVPLGIKGLSFSLYYMLCFGLLENVFYFLVFTSLHGIGQNFNIIIEISELIINSLEVYRREYSLVEESLPNNQKTWVLSLIWVWMYNPTSLRK